MSDYRDKAILYLTTRTKGETQMSNEYRSLNPIDFTLKRRKKNTLHSNKGKEVIGDNDFVKFNLDPLNNHIR